MIAFLADRVTQTWSVCVRGTPQALRTRVRTLDARNRAKGLGYFGYVHSYMSQPKSQLEAFKAWAGEESDISYYPISHHVDICASMAPDHIPVKVTARQQKERPRI